MLVLRGLRISRANAIITGVLFLLVVYTGWLLKQTQKTTLVTAQNDALPDFIAHDVVAIETDETGQLHNKFTAPKITHYAKDDVAIYDKPHIIAYSAEGKQPWDITAEHGQSTHGTKQLLLWGNVNIHEPKGTINNDTRMVTSRLTIYPNKNYAETDQPVTFTEPGLVVHSIGMKIYFKEKRVELLNQARGEYDASKAEKH